MYVLQSKIFSLNLFLHYPLYWCNMRQYLLRLLNCKLRDEKEKEMLSWVFRFLGLRQCIRHFRAESWCSKHITDKQNPPCRKFRGNPVFFPAVNFASRPSLPRHFISGLASPLLLTPDIRRICIETPTLTYLFGLVVFASSSLIPHTHLKIAPSISFVLLSDSFLASLACFVLVRWYVLVICAGFISYFLHQSRLGVPGTSILLFYGPQTSHSY